MVSPSSGPSPEEVTQLLAQASGGDAGARDRLLEQLFGQLRGLAQGQLRGQRAGHTLQATALVHEAWMRISESAGQSPQNRAEFLRFAARAMRSVLVDYARRRNASKRGGGAEIELLEEELATWRESRVDVLDLSACMERLEEQDEQLARLVELRFFGGLTENETAEVMNMTRRQVQHAWTLARAWLHRELKDFDEPELA